MGPSRSPDELAEAELELLVDIADEALVAALTGRRYEPPSLDTLTPALGSHRGAFVTLHVDGLLNGCIGDVAGREPLAHAVARLSLSAAFDDPRLPALQAVEYERLEIEVSVLSPMSPVAAGHRDELIRTVRPHVDGLMIRTAYGSGLFLPDVWAQLPDPDDFLDHLWLKAGLPEWVWPEAIDRFTTQHHTRRAGTFDVVPGREP